MENPTLSTMVVLYTTNLKFDTTKLAECLPIDETIIKVEKKGLIKKGESSRDKIKHRSKKEKKPVSNTGFGHNSITLVMMNDGFGALTKKEITIKIFQNGVFHLTGVLNELYDRTSMEQLMNILETSCKESFRDVVDPPQILNRRVVLMNYTTKLTSNETVPREALHTAIRNLKSENTISYYDPDVYPGVKIHIGNNKWTAKVFRTGKIILTGITCEEDCYTLMQQLLSLFEQVLPKKLIQENMLSKAVLA
jgi:TATA-box binding protein (TBP) (component of TFIID and TFIIIB)